MIGLLRVGLASCLLAAGLANATAIRLDDSASPRARVPAQWVLTEQGRPLEQAPFAESAVLRFGRVDYRLSTGPFMGRQARIYFVIPALIEGLRSPSAMRVDWRGDRFAAGSGRPGERHLVWTGMIQQAWLEASLELQAWVDLQQIQLPPGAPLAFECYFEIETFR